MWIYIIHMYIVVFLAFLNTLLLQLILLYQSALASAIQCRRAMISRLLHDQLEW